MPYEDQEQSAKAAEGGIGIYLTLLTIIVGVITCVVTLVPVFLFPEHKKMIVGVGVTGGVIGWILGYVVVKLPRKYCLTAKMN